MKNLLLIIASLLALSATAQRSVIQASFDGTTAILPGSQQWAYVTADTMLNASTHYDTLHIMIQPLHDDSTYVGTIYRPWGITPRDFLQLPIDTIVNENNVRVPARKVYFTIPSNIEYGLFGITFEPASWPLYYSRVANPNGIADVSISSGIIATRYYDLQGRLTTSAHGIVIREQEDKLHRLYREKVYQP